MIGHTISHYRILEKLGEGGMGVVFRAQDTKLDRTVALKFLHASILPTEEDRRRFVREAQTAASLNHPNIATVFEIDESEGQRFIAFEYIQGTSLAERIKAGPLNLAEALHIGLQIAEGLQAAHENGIVHRDIKSQNIMVTPKGHVKILDFGLAKLRGTSVVTKAGTTLGTLGYMSPEQLKGEATDHRSDVWALGIVLYEMVAGRRPFTGAYEEAVAYQVLHQQPEPLTAIRTGVPMELERLIHKAIAKNPNERYQHVDELLVDLRACSPSTQRSAETSSVHPSTTAQWSKRKKRQLFRWLAVIVVIIAAGTYYFTRQHGAHEVRSVAVLPLESFASSPVEEYFTDGMTEALITELSKIRALKVISPNSVMLYKNAKKPLPQVAAELGVDAVITGSVLRSKEMVRIAARLIDGRSDEVLWADSFDRKVTDVLSLSGEVARAIAEEVEVTVTSAERERLTGRPAVVPEAYDAFLKGRYYWNKRTDESMSKAVEFFESAIQKDPSYAPAYAGLADCWNMLSAYSVIDPREGYVRARAMATKAIELDEQLSDAHASLAWVLMTVDRNWAGAEHEFLRSIELSPAYATAHNWYSWFLMCKGREEESLHRIETASALEPISPVISSVKGYLFYSAGQYERAISVFTKTLEVEPSFPRSHLWLGLTLLQAGQASEAINELEQAAVTSGGNPQYLGPLGYGYAVTGKKIRAREILAQLETLAKRRYVSPFDMALVWLGLGHQDNAIAFLRKADENRDFWVCALKKDPRMKPLSSDVRYTEIIRSIGLSEQ